MLLTMPNSASSAPLAGGSDFATPTVGVSVFLLLTISLFWYLGGMALALTTGPIASLARGPIAKLAAAWAFTFAASQVTTPWRGAAAVALTPVVRRSLSTVRTRLSLNDTNILLPAGLYMGSLALVFLSGLGLLGARELGATIALPAVGAAPLLSASAIGAFALRDTPAGAAASPPMLAFTFALICSNLGLLPAVSPFYDACATTALPLSVALGLLAAAPTILDETSPQADSTTTALRPMLLAFGIGAIGTLIGSLLAFALSVSSGLLPSTSAAATAAALMCATYIGGSANFFGVATAVDARSNHPALLPALLAAD